MRFTSMTLSNSSGVVCSKVAKSPTAARCTQVSSLPYSSTARSATAFTCSKSEVSATMGVPSPPSRRISSARESISSSRLLFATSPAFELDRTRSRRISTGAHFSEELAYDRREESWLLDVRQVAAVGEEFERTLLQAADRLFPLPVREHPVLYSPHDKRRHR